MKISRLILMASLCLSANTLHAELGPIVVTGTKTEVLQSRSPVPVQVITSDQIRNSVATDAADLIQLYGNIDLARNGAYGQTTSIFIRGAESNHTLVLIDGVKMNPATIGLAALQNISPDIIEQIEIIKGPRSSLYGSEAVGGVINIITRKNVEGSQLNLVAGYGEDDTSKLGASAFYGNDRLSGGITVEQLDTEGFPVNDASSEDHGYDNETVNAFLDIQAGRSDIRISHWQAEGNVEYFSFGDDLDQDFKNRVSSVVWDYAFNGQFSSNLRVSSITDDIQQNQENFLTELDHATTDRDEVEWKLDYQTEGDLLFSLGLLSANEEVDALSFGTSIEEDTDIDATYVMLQSQTEKHSYALVLRESDHEAFGNETTWNIDYRYWVTSGSSLYAGAGTAFRAPDNTDRFGFIGNPDLDPETSQTIEFGIEHQLSANNTLTIAYFKNDIDDLIEPNATFTQVENIEKAEIDGLEVTLQGRRENWRYAVAMLSQDPINKETDEQLSRRARNRSNITLSYLEERWQAGGSLTRVGKRDNSSFDTIELASYDLVNLFMRYQINKSLDLSAKIENFFDEEYETAAGFNTKGRTAYMELSYALVQ